MTVQNVGDFDTGLDQFGLEDAVIPRLSIVHKDGEFKDSLSNEQYPKVRVIILGLVKQRVLWHPTVDEGDHPMCRSANFETGFPNLADEQPKEKRFPWKLSGFDPEKETPDSDGAIRLPCAGCSLKEWGSHPDGKKPYCSEQYTLPVLYNPSGTDDWEDFVPAIMTFQKTGLKPLRSYLTHFARSKNAAFMAVTEISLEMRHRGQTDYAVPTFKKVGETDEENWHEYSTNYRTMKEFLQADPNREEEEDGTPSSSDNTAKPPAKAEEPSDEKDVVDAEVVEDPPEEPKAEEKPKAEAKAEEPADDDDDDDLPF